MRRRGEERRTVARSLVCSCSYFLSHTHPVSQAAIAQCRFSLRPDGLFLGALFGGDTLHELRVSCSLAQMANEGGVSSVVSPFAQVRDAGNLLTRADMAMPTVDLDTYKLQYHCPTEIIRHLRSSAESNAAIHRQISLKRSTALAAAAIYRSMFGEEVNGKISYPATYHVIYLTGWSPHESQQRPKERGSATVSFQDLATGLIANENSTIAGDSNGILTPPVKSDQ